MVIDGKTAQWTNYHRTLEDFVRPWLHNGFVIVDIIEPKPSLVALKKFPEHLENTRKAPTFILFKLKKTS